MPWYLTVDVAVHSDSTGSPTIGSPISWPVGRDLSAAPFGVHGVFLDDHVHLQRAQLSVGGATRDVAFIVTRYVTDDEYGVSSGQSKAFLRLDPLAADATLTLSFGLDEKPSSIGGQALSQHTPFALFVTDQPNQGASGIHSGTSSVLDEWIELYDLSSA